MQNPEEITPKRRENKQKTTIKTTQTQVRDRGLNLVPSTKRGPESREPKQSGFLEMISATGRQDTAELTHLTGSEYSSSLQSILIRQSFKRYTDFPWVSLDRKNIALETNQRLSYFLNGIFSCSKFNKLIFWLDIRIL